MRKLKKITLLTAVLIIMFGVTSQYIYADSTKSDINNLITLSKYSNSYEKWRNLSDNIKENTIQPKFYDDINTVYVSDNPLYQVNLVGASISSKYSLKDDIPNMIKIKDQKNTQECWAFSALSSLETNLALKNKSKVYDFSERHMNYATTRLFKNNAINPWGYKRTASEGGHWYIAEGYLTNGQGAIDEKDMVFKNNADLIDISEIQNKDVKSKVLDTVYFDDYNKLTGDDRTRVMNEVKKHIQKNGSVFATIHADYSDPFNADCYNNNNGAKYCKTSSGHEINHAVSIIGWDDNYSKDNFVTKPTSNGAWIARNSWGEKLEAGLDEFKAKLFEQAKDNCIAHGWNSASEIPNEFIESAGFTIDNDKITVPVGDNGYWYISYEDCNVGTTLCAIENAIDKKDYDYIYQYNEVYPGLQITVNLQRTYLANIFEKQSNEIEYLKEVSLTVPETCTCKVYVNPNGEEKDKSKLQAVQLQAGDSEKINKGYHTLEFANPVEIKNNKYVVVVEMEGTRSVIDICAEGKLENADLCDDVKTETGKCFLATTSNLDDANWYDLGKLKTYSSNLTNCDSSIKAFTVKKVDENLEEEEDNKTSLKNSDFSKAKCKIKKLDLYYNSNDIDNSYINIDVDVTDIIRNLDVDSYEYYYYISKTSNENNINNWVKIIEVQPNKDKLSFKINFKDVTNYKELEDASNIYLYVKEVLKKDDNESTLISKGLSIDYENNDIEVTFDSGETKTYNGVNYSNDTNSNVESNSIVSEEKTSNQVAQSQSSTVSPTKLPYTGATYLIIGIIIIAALGIVVFIKYEILNKYVK